MMIIYFKICNRYLRPKYFKGSGNWKKKNNADCENLFLLLFFTFIVMFILFLIKQNICMSHKFIINDHRRKNSLVLNQPILIVTKWDNNDHETITNNLKPHLLCGRIIGVYFDTRISFCISFWQYIYISFQWLFEVFLYRMFKKIVWFDIRT